MPTPPFEHITYADFSGGFSDDLQTGERHIFEKFDNFLLTNEKKAYSREGSQLIGGSNFLTTVKVYAPTGDFINYQKDTNLLIRAKDKIFINQTGTFSGTWSALSGPNGNSSLPGVGNFASVTSDEFNNTTYFAAWDSSTNVAASPMKLFQAPDGSYVFRNAGLPKFPNGLDLTTLTALLNSAVVLVNDLRTQMQNHVTNQGGVDHASVQALSWGSSINIYATDFPNGFTGTVQRIYALYLTLRTAYEAHIEDARASNIAGRAVYHTQHGFAMCNYYLKPLTDPFDSISAVKTLLNLVPLLNELRRGWYMHVRSFSTDSTANIVLNFHAGTVYAPTKPALSYSPYPTFQGALTYSAWYTWLNNLIYQINLHLVSTPQHTSALPTMTENDVVDVETFIVNFNRLLWLYADHRSNNVAHTGTENATSATYSVGSFDFIQYYQSTQEFPNYGLNTPAKTLNSTESLYTLNPDLSAADANSMCQKLIYTQLLFNTHTMDTARHHSTAAGLGVIGGTIIPNEITTASTTLPSSTLTYSHENRAYAFHYRNVSRNLQGFTREDDSAPYAFTYDPRYPGLTNTLITNSLVGTLSVGGGGVATNVAIGFPTGTNVKPQATIGNLPALATDENWPTDTATIEIYRAATASSVYYKVGTILNNSFGFTDKVDSALLTNNALPTLYTTGNNIPYDAPPKSRCFSIVNGVGYYGGTTEQALGDTQTFPKRLRQSLAGQIDACPGTFYEDLESDIQTIGAARGYPIVVCSRGVYRIDGIYDAAGRGGMNPSRISDTVGGISPTAGATLNDRFYWFGADGIYVTDGFQVVKLSKHLDASFAALLQAGDTAKMKIRATVDRTNQRVLWTVTDPTGYAQAVWVLDVRHSTEDRGSFQRLSNGTSFAPTAIAIYRNTLYRGDEDGFVFAHTPGLTSDPKIDRGTHTLTGSTLAIPYQLRTAPDMLGYTHMRKWAPYAVFEFENLGNLSLQVGSINDKNAANLRLLNPIRYRGAYQGEITENRKFPGGAAGGTSGGLRCKSKQLDLQPANVILTNSDAVLTKCHISGTSVSLDGLKYDGVTTSAATFPTDCVDQYLCIEDDGYVTQYLITAQPSASTLTLAVAPPASGLSRKWLLRGVPKNERVQVNQMSIWFFPMTQTQHPSTGSDGNNA